MSYGGRMSSEKISSHGGVMSRAEHGTSESIPCRCGAEHPEFPELCVRAGARTCDTLPTLNNKLFPQTAFDLVYVQCSRKARGAWGSKDLRALHSCDQEGLVGESSELESPSGTPPGAIPLVAASFPSLRGSSPRILITYPSLPLAACASPAPLVLPPVASCSFPPSSAFCSISLSAASSRSSQPVVSSAASASPASRPGSQSPVCNFHDSCRYSDAAPFAPAPAPAGARPPSLAPHSSSIAPLPSNPTPPPTSTLLSATRRAPSKEASPAESRRENPGSFWWPRAGLAKRDNGLSPRPPSRPLFGFILKNRLTSRTQKDAMWRGRQTQLLRILATILALMTTSAVAYELKRKCC